MAVQGHGIGLGDALQQALIAGGKQGRATPGGIHVKVDLLAPGDGGELGQGIDGTKVRAAGDPYQGQHLELLLPASDQCALERREAEPVVGIGLEPPDAASPQPQQIHPLVEGVVHQPGPQDHGASITLLIEGKQIVATGPVAGQPESGDVGDGAAAGHDAEGGVFGVHLRFVKAVVLAIDETMQLGQYLPLQEAEQAGGLHLHRILIEHHQQSGELGGEGWQGGRHVSHVVGRGEMGGAWYQGGKAGQVGLGAHADGGHGRLIELMDEAVALVRCLTVIRVMEGLQQGRHGLAEVRIRLCKQFSQLHQVLQTSLSGRKYRARAMPDRHGHLRGWRRPQSIHQRGGGNSHLLTPRLPGQSLLF